MTIQKPDYVPADYPRINVVQDRDELMRRRTGDVVNCILLPRGGEKLCGNFNALARTLALDIGLDTGLEKKNGTFFYDGLRDIRRKMATSSLSQYFATQVRALDCILDDMIMAMENGMNAELRIVADTGYRDQMEIIDQFHDDGGKHLEDDARMMRYYNGPVMQYLRNEDAERNGADQLGGRLYRAKPGAEFFSFALGDMWIQRGVSKRGEHNTFIHRSRNEKGVTRMLLVCDPIRSYNGMM